MNKRGITLKHEIFLLPVIILGGKRNSKMNFKNINFMQKQN